MRPELRGRGHGLRIWNAAVAHAGGRTIGLDGVVAQQDNYKKSGFVLAYSNIRYGGTVATSAAPPPEFVPLADVAFAAIAADDATAFPAPREAFLRAWIAARGHMGRARSRRPARRLGRDPPLPHRPQDRAARCRRPRRGRGGVRGLAGGAGGGQAFSGQVFLDVPSVNRDAVALAQAHGLAPVFETARMYTGPIRPLRIERVFGVTTFELG